MKSLKLGKFDKNQILRFYKKGLAVRKIAKMTGRSILVVENVISQKTKKRSGTIKSKIIKFMCLKDVFTISDIVLFTGASQQFANLIVREMIIKGYIQFISKEKFHKVYRVKDKDLLYKLYLEYENIV